MPHDLGQIDYETREALQVLGQVLRDLRGSRGLSQRALAGRCGLSQATISRLECGLADGVRVAWVARLLVGLDMKVHTVPDARTPVERSHALRLMRHAFSPSAGGERRAARERRRQDRLEEIARQLHGDPAAPR
jgi:transcriptional regulator with XRE-family HTH domain